MTDKSLSQENEQNFLELFYSGEPANDLLLFEKIKQFPEERFTILMLVSLIAASRYNHNTHKEINACRQYIRFNFPKQYHSILYVFENSRNGDFSFRLFLDLFLPTFSKYEFLEIIYRRIKRLGEGHDIFLAVDNHDHPKRKEVFQDFLSRRPRDMMEIHGLFPDELEEYSKKLDVGGYRRIYLNNLKTNYLPEVFFLPKYKVLTFRNDLSTEEVLQIPEYIFRFKSVSRIELDVRPNCVFPEDWSRFKNVEEFEFIKLGPIFKNLNFADSLRSLKKINGILLEKKELMMEKPHLEINANYLVYRKDGVRVFGSDWDSTVANRLKKSSLSIERQKYFFSKIINVRFKWRNRENDRCGFTEDEIKELSVVDLSFSGGDSFTLDFFKKNKIF